MRVRPWLPLWLRKTPRLLTGFIILLYLLHKQGEQIHHLQEAVHIEWLSIKHQAQVHSAKVLTVVKDPCRYQSVIFATADKALFKNINSPLWWTAIVSRCYIHQITHHMAIVSAQKGRRRGKEDGKKQTPTTQASSEKMVTARRRWQEALIALPQLLTINNLHWEVQV